MNKKTVEDWNHTFYFSQRFSVELRRCKVTKKKQTTQEKDEKKLFFKHFGTIAAKLVQLPTAYGTVAKAVPAVFRKNNGFGHCCRSIHTHRHRFCGHSCRRHLLYRTQPGRNGDNKTGGHPLHHPAPQTRHHISHPAPAGSPHRA